MDTSSIRKNYNSGSAQKKYIDSVENIGLWKSEKLIFNKYVNLNNKILDLGCGAGRTTINLYKEGYENIIGLDIAEELIKYADNYAQKNNFNIPFYHGDATELPFHNSTFDVVFFSFNGIMTIPGQKNRDMALREIFRVLKSGGKFIFTAHDRHISKDSFLNTKYKSWSELKEANLFEVGDILTYDDSSRRSFIYISSFNEIKSFIMQEKFEILEYTKRSDIADENNAVKDFSDETVFWVVKKISDNDDI